MPTLNISRLQKQNDVRITSIINGLTRNTAVERGEDLDSDSTIEDILYNFAGEIVAKIEKSWVDKKFNPASTTQKFEPFVIDRAGVIKVLQISPANPEESKAGYPIWTYAETGRKKGKRPPVEPLENWITYRGIDVKKVKQWETKRTNAKGEQYVVKPYKNINNTLKLRHIMAESIATAIGRKGTIKRFGYKGSKFLSSVVNDESMKELSTKLSEAAGYTIGVRIAKEF